MVPSDLAASNAAGGQHPIRTAEREHEVCVCLYIVCQACASLCVCYKATEDILQLYLQVE